MFLAPNTSYRPNYEVDDEQFSLLYHNGLKKKKP